MSKLLSGAPTARFAAAEIIRWMGEPSLKDAFSEVIEREKLPHLRRAFRDADRFLEVEQSAREVLDHLSKASGLDQWRLIDALFELAPPECLGNRDDPLWIGQYFDRFSPALQNHINERYRAACDSIKRELRNRDEE